MCRFLAYLGSPITLEALLLSPEHSLLRQSYAPRHQTNAVANADGFGAGWYDRARRAEPARYRTARPMWSDRSFASLAGLIESCAVVAAVRTATPPAPVEDASTPPFTAGGWLFAHNGDVEHFHAGVGPELRGMVSDARAGAIEGASDSEVLFALILDRIDGGASGMEALADVVDRVERRWRCRLTFVLSDGATIAATACDYSLFVLQRDDPALSGVVVASEPFDDGRDWHRVRDRTLVEASAAGITQLPLGPARSLTRSKAHAIRVDRPDSSCG